MSIDFINLYSSEAVFENPIRVNEKLHSNDSNIVNTEDNFSFFP